MPFRDAGTTRAVAGRSSDAADVARQPPVSASPSAAVVMGTQPAGPRYQ